MYKCSKKTEVLEKLTTTQHHIPQFSKPPTARSNALQTSLLYPSVQRYQPIQARRDRLALVKGECAGGAHLNAAPQLGLGERCDAAGADERGGVLHHILDVLGGGEQQEGDRRKQHIERERRKGGHQKYMQ